jgi:hypothetical protein
MTTDHTVGVNFHAQYRCRFPLIIDPLQAKVRHRWNLSHISPSSSSSDQYLLSVWMSADMYEFVGEPVHANLACDLRRKFRRVVLWARPRGLPSVDMEKEILSC